MTGPNRPMRTPTTFHCAEPAAQMPDRPLLLATVQMAAPAVPDSSQPHQKVRWNGMHVSMPEAESITQCAATAACRPLPSLPSGRGSRVLARCCWWAATNPGTASTASPPLHINGRVGRR